MLQISMWGKNLYLNFEDKEMLFAQELFSMGKDEDTLLAISTSGNSRDVLLAVSVAKSLNMRTIGLTGGDGGKLKDLVDIAVLVDKPTTIYHAFCGTLERIIFNS